MSNSIAIRDPDLNSKEETSLKDMILMAVEWMRYFLSKWLIIVIFGLIGALIGLCYAIWKKPVYTATTSFVLESGSTKGGLGAYAGLASSFGIDIGNVGGGLFEGENILELYRSRNMISSALMSEGTFEGKKQLLVERYIDYNNLNKDWDEKEELRKFKFRPSGLYDNERQQLLHDSIVGGIVGRINNKHLEVEKKDKKLDIYYITVKSPDQKFCKEFNETLVRKVNRFYIDAKIKRNTENVAILQIKTDSVRAILSGAINRAASVSDATPNQNPTRMAQRVAPIGNARANAEISQQVLATLLQNLEMGKIALLKETPLIQIVDSPILPLPAKGVGRLLGLIIGGFIGGILIIGYLAGKRIIQDALAT